MPPVVIPGAASGYPPSPRQAQSQLRNMASMNKRGSKKSELERVARAGWMVTLRYRFLLSAITPHNEGNKWMKLARWSLPAGAVAALLRLKYG